VEDGLDSGDGINNVSMMDLANDNAEESLRHWEPPSSCVGNDKRRAEDLGVDPMVGSKWAWCRAYQLAP
jgi:hypothetical protein